jgi:hypothetical protein
MKNQKVRQFELKINQIVSEKKAGILRDANERIASFNEIYFETFTNENPYRGELKNKIFFTYYNHYRANSGTWMEVGELTHPHLSYEDRGYIKGVATDLDGYMKLKHASYLTHNFDVIFDLYYPHFRKSTHKEEYKSECDSIVSRAMNELNQLVEDQKKVLNNRLNELTGCSLLYYLRSL